MNMRNEGVVGKIKKKQNEKKINKKYIN